MLILLVVCLALLVYAWLLYPALLLLSAARGRSFPAKEAGAPPAAFTVVLAAHDEEHVIAARLRNLAETCGSIPGFRGALLGLDGCTDATAGRAAAAIEELVSANTVAAGAFRIFDFKARRGKAAVLKDLAARTDAGLLVFTDANTVFERDAVVRLLTPLSDPRAGAVVGRLILTDAATVTDSPEAFYWDWETRLKVAESALDSCLGANGAIYAARRALFWDALPDNTIVDDFVLGMKVREAGARVLFEPAAVARETLPEQSAEWRRRVRIGAGAFQSLRLCRGCLHPRYGLFAWFFFSHKLLRWLTPHLLLSAFVAALAGVGRGGPAGVLAALVLAGLAGLPACAFLARRFPRAARRLRLCDHFVSMQAALFVGFLRFCRGGLAGAWERTPRTKE